MIIQPCTNLIIIGDLITDCGRARLVGEGLFDALGKGYVGLVDNFLNTSRPSPHIRVINMGVSVNTVRDLKARWQTDVLDLQPDWLSIMIGVNGVWRHFDCPFLPEWHVPIDDCERILDE